MTATTRPICFWSGDPTSLRRCRKDRCSYGVPTKGSPARPAYNDNDRSRLASVVWEERPASDSRSLPPPGQDRQLPTPAALNPATTRNPGGGPSTQLVDKLHPHCDRAAKPDCPWPCRVATK